MRYSSVFSVKWYHFESRMRLICSSHRLLVLPVFVSLAMQCFGEKKIFEIHVKQSNESLGTRKVELDTNNLVAMGLKGDDMTRIIGILDDKGEVSLYIMDNVKMRFIYTIFRIFCDVKR